MSHETQNKTEQNKTKKFTQPNKDKKKAGKQTRIQIHTRKQMNREQHKESKPD